MDLSLEYTILDVFAERALEGNPLAVFHDARGLRDEQMLALARETNLSETTFVLPSSDPEEDLRLGTRVRIFTPVEELPFAGHPTLGTAASLLERLPALRATGQVTLRLNVGPVPVAFETGGGLRVRAGLAEAHQGVEVAGKARPEQAEGPAPELAGVFGTMRQPDPVFGERFAAAEVAEVLGLAPGDVLGEYAPQIVSTGNAFCIIALRSVEALERLWIPQGTAMPWLRDRGGRWFYCIAPHARDQRTGWRARMQWENGEDPATGSAAGPCIAWLLQEGLAAPGEQVELAQGVEIARPSRLFVKAAKENGRIHDVRVGGRTIPVASGRFLLPG